MKKIIFFFTLLFSFTQAYAEVTIEFVSDPGDYIGQGITYNFNDQNQDILFSRNYDNGISVNIKNLADDPYLYWTLNFAAPGDAEIQSGIYSDAERFPFQSIDNPGLSVSGAGRGCNTLTGSFEVYEVSYDASGKVSSFSASFEQHCGGQTPALRGTIVYNTVLPVGASAFGMTPYNILCKNRTTGQKLFKKMSEVTVDCRSLGLDVRSGDDIQLRIRAIAD